MREKATHQAIHFHFVSRHFALRDRLALKKHLAYIFSCEKTSFLSLSLIFCSDDYLLDINNRFLRHDYFTDIISFNLANNNDPVDGEIYISVDRVKENAHELGSPFTEELHRVIFHGVLHFCGYKDKSSSEKKMMRKKEDLYLAKYFD